MRRRPSHRSSPAVLRRLAHANLFWHAGRDRDDVIGLLPLPAAGLAVARLVAERFGGQRLLGTLGVRSLRGWSEGERLALRRWGPLVHVLPGLERWSAAEWRALVEVVRAKGGRRESEYVWRFDRHRRLREALRALALREDAANP